MVDYDMTCSFCVLVKKYKYVNFLDYLFGVLCVISF
jgi:hypothetical protein